jgi:hypothetical protein
MLNEFYAAFAPLSFTVYGLWLIVVAVAPGMTLKIGAPIRVEAVLLSLIVFLGVNVAWALMFDEVPVPEVAQQRA